MTDTGTAQPEMTSGVGLRRVLVTLCLTEVTSWGVLYYAFPVLSTRITDRTGWSAPAITAAFSGGLVVSALAGIAVGRRLDRRGPRGVMTAGSVLAVLAVLAIAAAPNLVCFAAAWLLAGVAMSGVLYPPAFAALTRWYGSRRVGALTALTLAAGLASTIFAPITAALADRLDWRGTYLVLAGVLAVVTVPAHLLGLRRAWPDAPASPRQESPTQTAHSRAFLALVAAMALAACASSAVVVNLVPLLIEHGASTGVAAIALGLGGAGQVLGRLGYGTLTRGLDVRSRTVLVLAALAATTALLGVFASLAALITFAVVAGTVRGMLTLLQATAITERWGTAHYGHLAGIMTAPVMLTAASAPWIGAALADALGGYAPMFLLMGGVGLLAIVASLAAIPSKSRPQASPA
jgi:MFS family permease